MIQEIAIYLIKQLYEHTEIILVARNLLPAVVLKYFSLLIASSLVGNTS